jgi:transcriptional regulator with XRE-family HTH domain
MTLLDIADVFRQARIRARLTQQDVADATGTHVVTISKFERGALTEIGAVKLLALLRAVGLELVPRPAGHARTLDDIARELDAGATPEAALPRRVHRRRRAGPAREASTP